MRSGKAIGHYPIAFVHSYPGIKKQKDEAINEYEVVGIYLYYS